MNDDNAKIFVAAPKSSPPYFLIAALATSIAAFAIVARLKTPAKNTVTTKNLNAEPDIEIATPPPLQKENPDTDVKSLIKNGDLKALEIALTTFTYTAKPGAVKFKKRCAYINGELVAILTSEDITDRQRALEAVVTTEISLGHLLNFGAPFTRIEILAHLANGGIQPVIVPLAIARKAALEEEKLGGCTKATMLELIDATDWGAIDNIFPDKITAAPARPISELIAVSIAAAQPLPPNETWRLGPQDDLIVKGEQLKSRYDAEHDIFISRGNAPDQIIRRSQRIAQLHFTAATVDKLDSQTVFAVWKSRWRGIISDQEIAAAHSALRAAEIELYNTDLKSRVAPRPQSAESESIAGRFRTHAKIARMGKSATVELHWLDPKHTEK